MNEELQRQLQANIENFAANVTVILTQAVREAVEAALTTPRSSKRAGSAGAPAAARARRRPTNGRGSSLDVDTVLAEVKRQGGRGVEKLAKKLGVKTKQLTLPLRKLIAAKKIKTKGRRRGMSYTAA